MQEKTKKIKNNFTTTPIRITKATAKNLRSMLDRINKKPHGRRVRVFEVIEKALTLLSDEHVKELQEQSLSNEDRLELQYKEHCQKNGFISKDEFLGILISKSRQEGL